MLRVLIAGSALLAGTAVAMVEEAPPAEPASEVASASVAGPTESTEAPPLDTKHSDQALAGAKAVIDNTRSKGAELMQTEQDLCKTEFNAVNEWQATIKGNAAERAKNKAARNADKAALGKAVAGRLASLNKFLAFLKTIRAQLGEHIQRTNKLFTAVFDANAQANFEASEVMKDLGFVVSLPWSPLVTPIKVPKK